MECDFLKLSSGAAGALGLPAFDAAFDRGGLVAVEPSDRSVSPSLGFGFGLLTLTLRPLGKPIPNP